MSTVSGGRLLWTSGAGGSIGAVSTTGGISDSLLAAGIASVAGGVGEGAATSAATGASTDSFGFSRKRGSGSTGGVSTGAAVAIKGSTGAETGSGKGATGVGSAAAVAEGSAASLGLRRKRGGAEGSAATGAGACSAGTGGGVAEGGGVEGAGSASSAFTRGRNRRAGGWDSSLIMSLGIASFDGGETKFYAPVSSDSYFTSDGSDDGLISTSSTSNTRVQLRGITGGRPRVP